MKKCPNCCNVTDNDTAIFCRKCGTKFPEQKQVTNSLPSNLGGVNASNDGTLKEEHPRRPPKNDVTLSSFNAKSENNNLFWAIQTCFKKYVVFNGRASRSEYWYFYLFNCINFVLFGALAFIANNDTASLLLLGLLILYMLVVALPGLAVTVRRLHDIGKSGWFYCVCFIPYVGSFILLYYLCKKSDVGANLYG